MAFASSGWGGVSKEYARQLRSRVTDAERILWKRLRMLKSGDVPISVEIRGAGVAG